MIVNIPALTRNPEELFALIGFAQYGQYLASFSEISLPQLVQFKYYTAMSNQKVQF